MVGIIIVIVVVVVIGLVYSPNETKAGLKYSGRAIKIAAKHTRAVHLDAKVQAMENPNIVGDNLKWLDENLYDTVEGDKNATKSYKESYKAFKEASKINNEAKENIK